MPTSKTRTTKTAKAPPPAKAAFHKKATSSAKKAPLSKNAKSPPVSLREEIYQWVRSIPFGKVVGYGQLGQMLSRPCSGLVVGKQIAHTHDDIPWWRVVGADGTLLLRRRSDALGQEQERLLQREGVVFDKEGRVEMKKHQWDGI